MGMRNAEPDHSCFSIGFQEELFNKEMEKRGTNYNSNRIMEKRRLEIMEQIRQKGNHERMTAMGAIHDSMNEKLIASEIKEALEMLECATNLSTASLDAIQEAINEEDCLVSIHKDINRESLEKMIAYALDL